MSQTVTTKLRGFVAAFTALVLTLALIPTTAFATLSKPVGSDGSTTLTGSITVTGITTDDASFEVYKIADIYVDSTDNVAKWVSVDDATWSQQNGETYPSYGSDLAKAITAWKAANGSTTTAADIVEALDDLSPTAESVTPADSGSNVVFSGLEPGIYYIQVTDATSTGITYQSIIASVELERDDDNTYSNNYWKVKDATVECKSTSSILIKNYLGDGTVTTAGLYTTGDTLYFSVQFTLSSYLSTFTLTDSMTGMQLANGASSLYLYSAKPTVENGQLSGGTSVSYTFTEGDNVTIDSSSYTAGTKFKITFDSDDIESLLGNDSEVTLYLVYEAEVMSSASTTGIYNTVWSSLTKPEDDGPDPGDDPSDPDDPGSDPSDPTTVVIAAGITIEKVDATTTSKTLSGATFEIYLGVSDGTSGYTYSGNPIATVTTGSGGTVSTNKNFKVGETYILVETVAPSGYVLEANPISYCELDAEDDDFENGYITIQITNTAYGDYTGEQDPTWGFNLPKTGGIGTIIFTVVGVLVMAGAAYLIIRSRKQQLQQQD